MADEKKIIIDEDWKSQVQAEKEAARSSSRTRRRRPAQPAAAPDDIPMPPASLEMLVTTLVTEAMISLGQVPHPLTGEAVVHPQQAKYLIDTIDMLREKTQGQPHARRDAADGPTCSTNCGWRSSQLTSPRRTAP